MSRSTFLKAAAGALGAASLLGKAALPASATAVQVTKIADLTGPGLTTRFRMEASDLGVPARTPDGRLLFVFGDTFEQARVGEGWWRSPVALPSDVITIGSTMYLHVMVNQGLGNVVWTEIWRSDDSGESWQHTGAEFPPDLHGGMFQLFTWGLGNDGFVYVYSTGFQRDKPIILHRVRQDRLTDLAAYEPWGHRDGAWAWGNPPTPILDGSFGELCLRPLGGKWVLTWFNAGDYRIDGIIMDTPTSNLYTAHRRTLIWGGAWGAEDDAHVAQLYGGYVIPGSTLDDLHLSVSQWNTAEGWPYRVMQHRIRGFRS